MESPSAKVWTTSAELSSPSLMRSTSALTDNQDFSKNLYLVGVQSRFRRKFYNKFTNHKVINVFLLLIILLLLIAVIVMACFLSKASDVCISSDCLRASTTFQRNMDFSADPCEDFFQFTCGNFEADHPRPDSQTSHDWFTEKQASVLREIRRKLEMKAEILGNSSEPIPVTKAKVLYQSCMDSAAADRLEYEPLFRYLKQYHLPKLPAILVDATSPKSEFDWIKSSAKIKRSLGVDKLIGFEIFPDPKNRTNKFLAIGSPSQENDMPFVDDVLAKRVKRIRRKWESASAERVDGDTERKTEESEAAFMAYSLYMRDVIATIYEAASPSFTLADNLDSISNAIKVTIEISRKIYAFVEMAENASKIEDSGGNISDLLYMNISELQRIIDEDSTLEHPPPVFEKYLTHMLSGIPEAQFEMDHDLVLTSNADMLYLKMAIAMIRETPQEQLEMFVWWSVVEDLMLYTTSEMKRIYYHYVKAITGIEPSPSRPSYCASAVNQLIPFAVSSLAVEENFASETKPKVEKMVENIRRSFNNLVQHATWMDWETKQKTLMKSDTMRSLIGFPDWIQNRTQLELFHRGLKIKSDAWMDNVIELLSWTFMKELSEWKLEKKFEWATSPTNVNAFHTFQANAITIPLAILQFPFYQLGLEALNYGSIGSILAHELTHGFDDIGRHFDLDGNKNYWWTNTTINNFINRTICFVKQYSEYYLPEIGDYINGETTLGENIADNGGLREAFYAYNYYVQSSGKEQKLAGFEEYSHEQLFFISFGNLWCETMTSVGLRLSLEDTHCPGKIRLLGVLSNFREFHNAFQCHPGQKYHRTDDQKCVIW